MAIYRISADVSKKNYEECKNYRSAFLNLFLNSCEADPNVLAKYVVALLRHDKGKELKSHCVEQLRDFLKDETEPFVDLLFTALEGRAFPIRVFFLIFS